MPTQLLQFSFRRREELVRTVQGCGQLVVASLVTGASSAIDYVIVPCFESTLFINYDDYRHHFYHCFTDHLMHLPQRDVAAIARSFISQVIDPANTAHRCSGHGFTSVHFVEFRFPQTAADSSSALDRAMLESFEEVVPRTTRAARLPLFDLIITRVEKMILEGVERFEADWTRPDCCICIDSIERQASSLTLPCSHVFHESCILRWFDTNHVCPLCRYEMPVESS